MAGWLPADVSCLAAAMGSMRGPHVARAADIVVSIAIGGAAGSVARYLLSTAVQERASTLFPAGTFVVNILGCLAVGFLMRVVLDTGEISPPIRALLTTGFCGGFTTFSTFAWETMGSIEEGAARRAALYAGGSVVFGLIAVWIGSAAAQLLLHAFRRQPA